MACALALALAGLSGAVRPAAAQDATEAGVKAAYLYKFIAYVEWPAHLFATRDSPQVIGVVGADAVLAELQPVLLGRRVNGRPVVARKVDPGDSLDGVHVLHLGRGARMPPSLAGRPVLVVTDVPNGMPELAVLNFITIDRRVRFEASLVAAEQAGLRLSARLLAVAERVASP